MSPDLCVYQTPLTKDWLNPPEDCVSETQSLQQLHEIKD